MAVRYGGCRIIEKLHNDFLRQIVGLRKSTPIFYIQLHHRSIVFAHTCLSISYFCIACIERN